MWSPGFVRSGCAFALAILGCGGDDFTSAGGEGGAGTPSGTPAGTGAAASGAGGDSGGATTGPGSGGALGTCENAAQLCLHLPPDGWEGPAALYGGPMGEEPPECSAAWPREAIDAFSGSVEGNHSCEPCTCEAPAGAKCDPPQVITHNTNCVSTTGMVTPSANGSCSPLPQLSGALKIGDVDITAGTCAAKGGDPVLEPPSWQARAKLCVGADLGQCDGGVCAPPPEAPFNKLCVFKQGEARCPAGYPDGAILYDGYTDTRGCDPCLCGAPAGATCSGTVSAFQAGGACDGPATVLQETICNKNVTTTWGSVSWSLSSFDPGACAPSGGQETGMLTPSKPITICCAEPG